MSIKEFFEISDLDQVVIQLTELLRSDEKLMGWTSGNIQRLPFLEIIPDAPPPQITVSVMSEDEIFQPSGNAKVTIPVAVLILWEDERVVLEIDEPSINSVVQHLKGLLATNYYMKTAPEDTRIIRRIEGFETVDYGGVEVDGRTINYLVLAISFEVMLNVRSRKRNCYV